MRNSGDSVFSYIWQPRRLDTGSRSSAVQCSAVVAEKGEGRKEGKEGVSELNHRQQQCKRRSSEKKEDNRKVKGTLLCSQEVLAKEDVKWELSSCRRGDLNAVALSHQGFGSHT